MFQCNFVMKVAEIRWIIEFFKNRRLIRREFNFESLIGARNCLNPLKTGSECLKCWHILTFLSFYQLWLGSSAPSGIEQVWAPSRGLSMVSADSKVFELLKTRSNRLIGSLRARSSFGSSNFEALICCVQAAAFGDVFWAYLAVFELLRTNSNGP